MFGVEIVDGFRMVDLDLWGNQHGLFIILFDRYVIISITMHYYTGLKDVPKVSCKQIIAHTNIVQIYVADAFICMYILLYALLLTLDY